MQRSGNHPVKIDRSTSGRYSKEFFGLQILFARKVRDLSGMPLERALLGYTNLYVRFGLGRDFDPDHVGWRSYLAGLDGQEALEWTYRVYSTDPETWTSPTIAAFSGCFSYAIVGPRRIRLHFRNRDHAGGSSLALSRMAERRGELATLFQEAGRTLGEDTEVAGASWLYNIEAYRRLFPPGYLASARVEHFYRSMTLWGQFVDRRGQVKKDLAGKFAASLERLTEMSELATCFALPVLAVRAPVRTMVEHYERERE